MLSLPSGTGLSSSSRKKRKAEDMKSGGKPETGGSSTSKKGQSSAQNEIVFQVIWLIKIFAVSDYYISRSISTSRIELRKVVHEKNLCVNFFLPLWISMGYDFGTTFGPFVAI